MSVSKTAVVERLRRVKGPDLASNIVDLGMVSEVLVVDGRVTFSITVPANRAAELEPLREAAEKVVKEIAGVEAVTAVLTAEARSGTGDGGRSVQPAPATPPAVGPRPAQGVANVKHLVAVASGKGGVGKSTVAVNLALGFAAQGLKAGILDADIYGPSQPRLLGLKGRPEILGGRTLRPMIGHGIEAMSMGFMVDEGTPVVWRGPMVVQALNQMLREVAWGNLDVLVIDMPPGTGDVQLTIAQQVPLSGAIIVSTPQDLALIDARKALVMFQKVDVPVLGIVENMSTFVCPKCGTHTDIFGHGGAEEEAKRLGVPFLGAVPLDRTIRETSDEGQPVTATAPESANAKTFRDIAGRAWAGIEGVKKGGTAPDLSLSPGRDGLIAAFADGTICELSAELLRVMSPSAEVQGHSAAQRVTVGGKRNVKINDLRPVGNYAVRIVFDDGHDTGLFSWDYLRELCRDKDKRWSAYLRELDKKGIGRG